jgi:flagellar hook-associated protein FlgK
MPSSWGGGVPSNEQKQEFFNQAGLFASTFSDVARQLESLRDANGDRIAATISQINGLTKGIADSTASGALGEAQLTSSLQQLSELVDVTVTANADGTVGVLMGGQVPLVSAGKAYSLAVGPPAAGNTVHVFDSDGKDVTTVISDGTLGGLLSLQNVEFPGLLGDLKSTGALNTLASKIAFSVNPAFSPLGLFSIDLKNPKNSAASLQLNSALDPSTYQFTATRTSKLIALGASTAGDPALNGLGFADYYESIVTGTSLQASDAKVFSDRHSTLLEQASELRDRVSGVDTNTEAVELLQIQQGYLAITKVMSSVNELLASLMNLVS